ncbi:hypothetical protein SBA4_40005 [Candidatus Sulfopaludibacter sp. SbA4]|nr:hypothetical protein SBA4_40005 [Candidatus Sulfopaludibacter sp. SbA4]
MKNKSTHPEIIVTIVTRPPGRDPDRPPFSCDDDFPQKPQSSSQNFSRPPQPTQTKELKTP